MQKGTSAGDYYAFLLKRRRAISYLTDGDRRRAKLLLTLFDGLATEHEKQVLEGC